MISCVEGAKRYCYECNNCDTLYSQQYLNECIRGEQFCKATVTYSVSSTSWVGECAMACVSSSNIINGVHTFVFCSDFNRIVSSKFLIFLASCFAIFIRKVF